MLYFAYCFIMYCIVNVSCTIRIKLFFKPFVLYTCIDLHCSAINMMQKKKRKEKESYVNYVTYLYFASMKRFSQTLGFSLS